MQALPAVDVINNKGQDAAGEDASAEEKAALRRTKISNAIRKILSSNVGGDCYILSKKKDSLKARNEDELQLRAEKILRKARRARFSALRKNPKEYDARREKLLRKTATSGVIKLLNAVNATQRAFKSKKKDASESTKTLKEDFLKLIQKDKPAQKIKAEGNKKKTGNAEATDSTKILGEDSHILSESEDI